jgi:phosphoribosylformylglycinamidine synthase
MKSNARVIYIEKKSPFNVEAVQLLHDLRTNLNIKTLHNARILNKYIIANVDDKTYRSSLNTIFSEPPVDLLFLKQFPKKPHENAFGVAFLPGQFDQRSDSAEQCLKLINPKTNAIVKTATIYVLEGKLPHDIINKIKKYLINPTDSHEININSRDYLIKYTLPKPIEHINGFTKWSKLQLEK